MNGGCLPGCVSQVGVVVPQDYVVLTHFILIKRDTSNFGIVMKEGQMRLTCFGLAEGDTPHFYSANNHG